MTEGPQEAPKWMRELEAKREKRLKVRLGHETGAGSPCLTCGEKCPGLDLHFWRKICKNCKCGKESHDVQDNDVYGLAQFQLTGFKPTKPTKIILPGKKEEVLLEWTPKGQNEAVESYLKDLPSHLLPIKGSPAAQQRKQLLKKQIPLHDIDPLLCDALTEHEIKQMNDYVEHIKQNSVGIGQIVTLNELRRGYRHEMGHADAELLANRVLEQVPNAQTVHLQGAEYANAMKNNRQLKNLPNDLRDLSLNQKRGLNIIENDLQASDFNKMRDIRYDSLRNIRNVNMPNKPVRNYEDNQNPSVISGTRDIGYQTGGLGAQFNDPRRLENMYIPNRPSGNVLDYQNPVSGVRMKDINYSVNTNEGPWGVDVFNNTFDEQTPENFPKFHDKCYGTDFEQYPQSNQPRNINLQTHNYTENPENFENMQETVNKRPELPHYVPGKFNTFAEQRKPQPISHIRDLAFTTYDLNKYPESEREFIHSKTHPHGLGPLNFDPDSLNVEETQQNPTLVHVGLINDIEYPANEIKTALQRVNEAYDENLPQKFVDNSSVARGIMPGCHKCKKTFEKNAVVIGTERTHALWHTDCFKCAGCNQDLADLFYFYDKESDDIYCGRDYAKIRGIPRCQACDELIFVKEYCLAEHCTFHVKHFCCYECDVPLAGQNYLMEDSQPLCLPCYENLKAEKCSACLKVIKPDEQGANLNGVHFHATDECFSCRMCKKALLGTKLLLKNQKLYCSSICFAADTK